MARRIATVAALAGGAALAGSGHASQPRATHGHTRLARVHAEGLDPRPHSFEVSRSGDLLALPVVSTSTTETSQPEPVGLIPTPPAVHHSGWEDLGSFTATCYALRGTTASGRPAGPGSIAVDPAVIPLGTHLRVAGYGEGVADDTGGAIRGRRVDVWLPTEAQCRAWGVRWADVERAA